MTAIRTIWITRAEPGASRTAEGLTALGFAAVVVPLLAIRRLDVRLDLSDASALAFTSRNGVAAFADMETRRDLPVFTVGDATATAARAAGFADVTSASGDVGDLATLLKQAAPVEGVILHLTARLPAGDLGAAVGQARVVHSVAVYEAVETDAEVPDAFDAVLIHSPRAARALATIFTQERAVGRIGVAVSAAAAAPLAALPFAEVRVAARPDEAAMIAALGKPGPRV